MTAAIIAVLAVFVSLAASFLVWVVIYEIGVHRGRW